LTTVKADATIYHIKTLTSVKERLPGEAKFFTLELALSSKEC